MKRKEALEKAKEEHSIFAEVKMSQFNTPNREFGSKTPNSIKSVNRNEDTIRLDFKNGLNNFSTVVNFFEFQVFVEQKFNSKNAL